MLHQMLGGWTTLWVVWAMTLARLRRQPYRELPQAGGDAEVHTREQAQPAILLYGVLVERVGRARALEVTRAAVIEGAVLFLRHTIGTRLGQVLSTEDPVARANLVKEIGGRFFNATLRWDEISSDAVRFTVSRCLFVELCQALDCRELAPVFCEGDGRYFGHELAFVQLERPQTLAGGGRCCQFQLSRRRPQS